ncbi:MAG: 50S ribosomal protein L3 [Clostridiales bacterium]|nr:50S ribosomal protein L3 [Clostridiales bacterium]
MPKAILGKKLGMSQIFTADGKVVPVTVVAAGPCAVIQLKTLANEGYEAVKLAYGEVSPKKLNKPELGQFKKLGATPSRYLREIRVEDSGAYQTGQEIKAGIFAAGEIVDVIGRSKGKGFAGTIKRWNQRRGPMSHGSKNHRRPSSAGAKGPARVFKGKHSPGRMGGERVTVKNLQIVKVDAARDLLLIRGAVPGPKEGFLVIKSAGKLQ